MYDHLLENMKIYKYIIYSNNFILTFLDIGYRAHEIGYRIQDTGYRIQDKAQVSGYSPG